MQYNIDTCNYTNISDNKYLTEVEVEIKKEIESKDLIPLENLIKNEHIEMIQTNNGYINYENFKLKNEEVDLKYECNDADLSTYECGKVDFGKEISSDKYMNSVKEEKEHEVNDPEINVLEKNFKCTLCSKAFTRKINLDKHLLKIHKCRDVRKNLHNCDQCSYETLEKWELLLHKLKHDTNHLQNFKCRQCTFETYYKYSLMQHIKIHENIKEFKCTFCSKAFTQKINLDNHLFRIHKCKNIGRKLYNCDQCSCEYPTKMELLRHKIKHGITDGIPILKCYQCTFETYHKGNLSSHVKIHQNIKDFKCTYCSKEFTHKNNLNLHLLRIHKCRDVGKRLHNCDQCSYEASEKRELLLHKLKHSNTSGLQILKCHECTFETYHKSSLTKHIKIHGNMKEFKCTLCSKAFTQKINLDNHLFRIHKSRNVGKKLYNCDQCSCEYLAKKELLRHKVKHGITDGIPILKCSQCSFETYHKGSLINHVKIHQDIKDFKCTHCSVEFTHKNDFERHLFKIHQYSNVGKKNNCDQCSYVCSTKGKLLQHKIKHGITDGIPILKCHQCSFGTYRKSSLINHVKIHGI